MTGGTNAEKREQLLAEAERMAQWCDEQIGLQRERMAAAQKVLTVYATEQYAAQTIGPDRDEMAFRSECANNFWRIAKLLRGLSSTTAALRAAAQDSERLREALHDIIDPIAKLRREMPVGYLLNGEAVRLAENSEHLRNTARAALAAPEADHA